MELCGDVNSSSIFLAPEHLQVPPSPPRHASRPSSPQRAVSWLLAKKDAREKPRDTAIGYLIHSI
jgi:hypothetical protein